MASYFSDKLYGMSNSKSKSKHLWVDKTITLILFL